MPLAFNLLRCLRQRSILRPQEFRRRTGLEQAHGAYDSKRTEEQRHHLAGVYNSMRLRRRSTRSRHCCDCIFSRSPCKATKLVLLCHLTGYSEVLRSDIPMFRIGALYRNPEKQVRLQPSASGGVPEPTAPSRVSGRAASAWHWARSSSHPRHEWAANAVRMGSSGTS